MTSDRVEECAQNRNRVFAGQSVVEPDGIEPSTSCSQKASDGDPMSVRYRNRP
jgi:hypothetical protein